MPLASSTVTPSGRISAILGEVRVEHPAFLVGVGPADLVALVNLKLLSRIPRRTLFSLRVESSRLGSQKVLATVRAGDFDGLADPVIDRRDRCRCRALMP